MRNRSNRAHTWSMQQSIFNRAFTIAGLGFLAICLVGLSAFYILDATEVGRQVRESTLSGIYQPISKGQGMGLLTRMSIGSMILIMVTGVMQFIWWFRIQKVSRTFIYIIWTGYIIGQGLGFGFLFLTFKASELFLIFGLAGGLFLTMAAVGYYSKNLTGMRKYLWAGTLFSMFFGLVLMILTLSGVFNLGDKFGVGNLMFDLLFFFSGILLLFYIMYTVWRLQQISQYAEINGMDDEMRFRYIAFFGFRLMSDMVALVWTIARFVMRMRK